MMNGLEGFSVAWYIFKETNIQLSLVSALSNRSGWGGKIFEQVFFFLLTVMTPASLKDILTNK